MSGQTNAFVTDIGLDLLPLPVAVATALRNFLVDGKRGNVTLNIKDGEILGCHIEEILSVKAPRQQRRTA